MILKFLAFGIWTIAANILFLRKSSAHFSWPQGRIPYLDDFALTSNPDQSVALNNARMDLQVRSCIKFIPRKFEKDFVFFTDLGPQVECWNMFDQTKGRIEVNAGPSCLEPMRKPYRPKQVFSDCDIEYVNHLYNCPRRRNHVSPICPLGQNIMAFPETTTKPTLTVSLNTNSTTNNTTDIATTTIKIDAFSNCSNISTTSRSNNKEENFLSSEYYVDDNVNNINKKNFEEYEENNENRSDENLNLQKNKNNEKNSFEVEINVEEDIISNKKQKKTSVEENIVDDRENLQNEDYLDENDLKNEINESDSLSSNKNTNDNSFEKENNQIKDNYDENEKSDNSKQFELINYDNEDEENFEYETTERSVKEETTQSKNSYEITKAAFLETDSNNYNTKTSTVSSQFLSSLPPNIPTLSTNYWSLTPSTLLSLTLITSRPTEPTLKPFMPDWVRSLEESFERQEKLKMNKQRYSDIDEEENRRKNPRIAIEIIERPRLNSNRFKNNYITETKKGIYNLYNLIKKSSDEIIPIDDNESDDFGIQRTKVITTIEKTNYIGSCGSACLYSGDLTKLYRAYNEKPDGKINHFYTTDRLELHYMASQGYVVQPSTGYLGKNHIDPTCSCLKPLYRLYNDFMKDHLLTSTEQEKNIAERLLGYKFEKVLGFCTKEPGCGAYMPLYRFYNAIAKDHLYTIDQQEMNYYKSHPELAYGFEYIECYVWQHNTSVKDCPAITISVPNKSGFARL